MDKILDGLNEKQKQAVQIMDGPLMVTAGAGSGKTRVLTHRIAYMVANGVWTSQILAITFTRKATEELQERLAKLLPNEPTRVDAMTFHQFCVKVLRVHGDFVGIDPHFGIADADDSKLILHRVVKKTLPNGERLGKGDLMDYQSAISNAKNALISPDDYLAWTVKRRGGSTERDVMIANYYADYQRELNYNHLLDFDDLLVFTARLFKNNPAALSFWQAHYRYISVDEYQDTNFAQYQIVKLLARRYQNLCIVGDSDQSIYGWRGADPRNFKHFKHDFPNYKEVVLDQNYRSTNNILKAANDVIENNPDHVEKKLHSDLGDGDPIFAYQGDDKYDQGNWIVKQIEQLIKKGYKYQDIALLYRKNKSQLSASSQLTKHNIPFEVVHGLDFYSHAVVKDVLAYCRLLVNRNDNLACLRVINTPHRGIGMTTINKLQDYASDHQMSLLEACEHVDQVVKSKASVQKVLAFADLISQLKEQMDDVSLTDLVPTVLKETGYQDLLKDDKKNLSYLDDLQGAIQTYTEQYLDDDASSVEAIQSFIDNVVLSAAADGNENQDRVKLMTIHAAKGLEFRAVFIVDFDDEDLPTRVYDADIHEERRLAYVAITRAKEKLFFSLPATIPMWIGGVRDNVRAQESQFIREIRPELVVKLGSLRK